MLLLTVNLATHLDLVPRAKKASDCNCLNNTHTDYSLLYSILMNFSLMFHVMGEKGNRPSLGAISQTRIPLSG